MVSTSLLSTEFLSTAALHSSLTDQFKLVVDRHPQKTAVSDQKNTLSYCELWDQAVALSVSLEQLPAQRLIAIESGVSTKHIVAIWAVLLAGHTYTFLPPMSSTQDQDPVIDCMEIDATIAIEATGANITFQNKKSTPDFQPHQSIGPVRHSQSAACVVMTSGSTGAPKLVVFEDQHLIFEAWRQNLDTGLCPEDNIDLLFSLHFSASLACIFPALLTGASLHLLDLAKEGWAILPEWWLQQGITIANLSTSTFRKLISINQPIVVPAMKMLGIGAEAMNKEDVNGFLTYFPESCELQQSYASTEARTISHWLLRKHGWDHQNPVPVGYAVTGKQIKILNPDGSVVQEGDIGEIYVESDFIPGTYWESTHISWHTYLQRSRPSRQGVATGDMGFFSPSGSLVLTGRKDFQIKIRGQKVSPEWVENTLKVHLGKAIQITVADHAEYGYIGVLGPEITQEERARIHAATLSLPVHMRPARWFQFNIWPTNRNGKFDRHAIMSMSCSQTVLLQEAIIQDKSTLNSSTSTVLGLIEDVLDLENISPHADFFNDLGGDSLNAVEVWGSVLEAFSISAPFELMHRLRTAEAIGNWIAEQTESIHFITLAEGKQDIRPIICLSPMGTGFKCYESMASCWDGDQPLVGFLTPFGHDIKQLSVLADESCHKLEARFPTGPITLFGFSYAGVLVATIGKKLLTHGRHVDMILIDTPTYRPTSLWWKVCGYPFSKLRQKRINPQPLVGGTAKPTAKLPSFYKQQLHFLQDFSPVMDNPTGMTIVFEALAKSPKGFHYKRDMDWEKWVSGKIRKYSLPTTHSRIVKSPWIEEIARVIQLLLPCEKQSPEPGIAQSEPVESDFQTLTSNRVAM